MTRKVCVITGANRGLGKAMAIDIARQDYEIVLICRNIDKANKVKEEIIRETGNAHIRIIKADMSSMTEVINAAEEVKSFYPKIDVLINNAGVFLSKYAPTTDGLDEQYAVNYLSVWLFTMEMVDMLNRSAAPRVINVGSNLHRYGSLPLPVYTRKTFYNGVKTYANTKLAVMMFTFEFANRFKEINTNVFHPGTVDTEIGNRYSHGIYKYGWRLLTKFFIPASKGAETGVWLAYSPEVTGKTGLYFFHKRPVSPSARSRNKELSKKLWENTNRLIEQFRHKPREQKVSV